MKECIDRRRVLRIGVGSAALLLGARPLAFAARAGCGSSSVPAGTLEPLVALIRSKSRKELPTALANAIAGGASRDAVLGAVFLAGIHEVRPRPVGVALHCVMMVESVSRLTDGAPDEDKWPAVLWAADDFKDSQETDRRVGDWVLPARPRLLEVDRAGAVAELRRAMDAFDPELADRAVTTLVERGGVEDALEALWPYAARSFTNAGHRIVFASQAARALRRIGVQHAEPVLRSVVLGLADDSAGDQTAMYERARGLAEKLPESWQAGHEDPEKSVEVLRALRGKSPEAAQDAALAAFVDGLGPQTVWDGLRLVAAELMLLRPDRRNLFPVHVVTEQESLGYAWESSRADATRRILVLQAAAWVHQVRAAVISRHGAYADGPAIDELGKEARDVDVGAAVDERSPALVMRAIDSSSTAAGAFVTRIVHDLVPRADQDHQYKLMGAALEESLRVHPRWRSRMLAPAVDYLPGSSEAESIVHGRSLAALRSTKAI